MQISKSSLSVEVAEKLRQMINTGILEPGSWLDEQGIAQAMGVSRTPLREAVRLLSSEGLLRLVPRKGCYVSALNEQDLDEIFPLMAMLEGRCAYEAALRATSAEIEELAEMHDQLVHFATKKDVDDYYAANRKIHEYIQRIAGNQWLSNLVDDLRGKLNLSRHQSLSLEGRIDQSCKEHLAIFAAIKAQDPKQADSLTNEHLINQRKALRQLSESQGRS